MGEAPNQRRWNDAVSDLPAFHGNSKDTITAESIVIRVEAAALALAWDDVAMYHNFSLSLRSNAEEWLSLQADIRGAAFLKTWEYIKPIFLKAFGAKMDESKVYMILKDIGQKPGELVRDFAIRFNKGYRIIKSMTGHHVINVPAAQADRTVEVCQKLYADGYADALDDMRKILFVSTLEMALLTKVVQKTIPTFVDAMECATQIQMLAQKQPSIGSIGQINQINESENTSDAEFVNQIQQGYHNNRGNNRGNSRGRGNRGQSRGNRGGNSRGHFSGGYYVNNGNNGNQGNNGSGGTSQGQGQNKDSAPKAPQPEKCNYCNTIGHHQDRCNKRIAAGKPCVSASGKNYFPKPKAYPVDEEQMDKEMGQQGEYQNAVREERKSEYLFQ
jgi:hypothetical protein